jgi:hypothetical protein
MRRRILVTASAMMLATQLGSPISAAEPSSGQLNTIAALLEANDVQGLRTYLETYPELAEGDTPLAALLRRFLVESMATNRFHRFRPDLSDAIDDSRSSDPTSEPQGGPGGPGSAY